MVQCRQQQSQRATSTRTLTNGTPGVLDHEDAHTVTVALAGILFRKDRRESDQRCESRLDGRAWRQAALHAALPYDDQPLNNFRIVDDLDALNALAAFAPGTLSLGASPAGADISGTSSTGGSKGTGVIDIGNLNVLANGEADDSVRRHSGLRSPTARSSANQSTLRLANGTVFAVSDDPNVNGAASPTVSGDEDPTRVTIASSSGNSVDRRSSSRSRVHRQ